MTLTGECLLGDTGNEICWKEGWPAIDWKILAINIALSLENLSD